VAASQKDKATQPIQKSLHLERNNPAMKQIGFFSTLMILFSMVNCSKNDNHEDPIEPVSITYQAKLNINTEGIINDRIDYNEILGYDTALFSFLLEENAVIKINGYFFPSGGLPFTLKVKGEEIYSGLFFPSYSSNTPCGYLVEPVIGGNNTMNIRLDYGLCLAEGQIIDNRNDRRLIDILTKDNKIITIDN